MLGTYALSAGYYDAFYGQAQKVRTVIKREHDALFERFDVLVSPTCPTTAFPVGAKTQDPLAMYLTDVLTIPSCIAGLPGPLGARAGSRTGSPSASSSSARSSGRTRSSGWATRSRRRSPSTSCRSGSGDAVGGGHRARDPRPPEDADEDVLPLRARVLRGAELADVSRLPRLPRRAPCTERPRGRAHDQARARARLRDRRARRLRTEELLLPGPPEGLPDLPVRQAALPAAAPCSCRAPTGERRIGITRAHLEEDAAKTIHVGGAEGRIVGAAHSLVDFNRGGTPLLEIVTEPDIHSSEEARRFLQLLRQTIVELGISDAEMEKGTLRCDANVSVRPAGSDELRTRCELKNVNSFNFVARGIDALVAQQIASYEAGGEVEQETYDYDAASNRLTVHRSKEEADDYRYFPEPDLVPVEPDRALVEQLRAELPEAPGERIRRLEAELGLETALGLVTGGRDRLHAALVAARAIEGGSRTCS